LDAADTYFAQFEAVPVGEALRVSGTALLNTLALTENCQDPEVRDWYDGLLNTIGVDVCERVTAGYQLRTGLPPDGNPFLEADDAAFRIYECPVAPDCVVEWFRLRRTIVQTWQDPQTKLASLRSFFSYLL
jgi:hypothetical protein